MKTLLRVLLTIFAACTFANAQSKPLDLSLGWNYSYTDEGNGFANLNGWYGTATWEFSQRVGASIQHQSFWGSFQGSGTNQHAWLGGFTVKLRQGNPTFSPFIQPMAGATRSSSSGSVQQEPTIQIAGGADIKLKGNLSAEIIPAEYTFTHCSGSACNSYQAAAGLQYSFGKK